MRRFEPPILDALPALSTASILDVGCGDGALLDVLKRLGYLNYYGIDVDEKMVHHVRKRHGERVSHIDILWGRDISPKYNCIILCDLLEHLATEDVQFVLSKLYRGLHHRTILRGTVIIRTPNAEGLGGMRLRYGDPTHTTAYTRQSLRTLLLQAGFTDIQFYEATPIVHGPVSFIRRCLWELVSLVWRCLVAIETGEFGALASSNLICIAR